MYGKVYAQLFDGTLHGRLEASAVFMAMIAMADEEGIVDLTLTALANRTGWPIDFIERGIRDLEADDPHSRTPDLDGRRILRIRDNTDWGWVIVNYLKYRDIKDNNDRKRYMREYMREYRASKHVNSRKPKLTELVHTDTDTDTDTEVKASKKVPTEHMPGSAEVTRVFDHWRSTHNHPRAKLDAKRTRVIREALKGYGEADLCQAITGYLNSPHHMGQNTTGTRFDDIELFLRDAKHVDAGLRFYADPPRQLSSLTRQNIAAAEAWLAPESSRG